MYVLLNVDIEGLTTEANFAYQVFFGFLRVFGVIVIIIPNEQVMHAKVLSSLYQWKKGL